MSRKFKLPKDYFGEGIELWKKRTITLNPGVTVMVGCNGIGKTSLLRRIEYTLKDEKIPFIKYDNLHDGGSNARSAASFYEDFAFMATSMCSSEGENIVMNLGRIASRLKNFIETGVDNDDFKRLDRAFARIFDKESDDKKIESNERWILLDAIDSGLSIDNINDVKELLFKTVIDDNPYRDVYIIVVANSYEMARNEQCFDVRNGKYIKFDDYEDYRNFILKSKEWKDERDNQAANVENQE